MRKTSFRTDLIVAVELVSTVVLIAALSFAAVDAPPSTFAQPALAASRPSPVVSVTTLPAVPSPGASVHAATPLPAASPLLGPIPPGTVVSVGGLVSNPMTLTLKDLQSMRHTTLTLRVLDRDGRHRFHFFSGVLLRDIVDRAHPNVIGGPSNSAAAYVLVEGLNGAAAIIGFPEFEQSYNNKQVLVAFEQDSRPLDTPGIARLIVPEDATAGRFVSGITSITIGEPPR